MSGREHIVQLCRQDRIALAEWLLNPNGSFKPHERANFEAVENGGLLVRTLPYTSPSGGGRAGGW